MDFGPTEFIVILVIAVLLFGPGRIARLGHELGTGIREFKRGLSGEGESEQDITVPPVTNDH